MPASATRTRYRFDRSRRIGQGGGFDVLLREASRCRLSGYIFYLKRRASGPPRLGIMVSRKHSPRATVRNRIKRAIREAFRLEQHGLGALDVIVRPPLGVAPSPRMLPRLRALFASLPR